MNKSMKGKILLYVSAFFWGMGFLGLQGALNSGWQTFAILTVRGFIAGSILLVFALKSGIPWWQDKAFIKRAIFAGVVMWIGFAVQTYGQSNSSISLSAIITGLYVVFTPFIANLFKRQQLPIKLFVGCFMAFIATVLISYDGSGLVFGYGELLLLISALIYSIHFLLIESLGSYKIAFALSAIQLLTMGVCSLIMMIITKQTVQIEGFQYVLFLALFCSGLAFYCQMLGQEGVNSSVASFILSFESIFGVIGAIILFHEAINWQITIGCLLMVVAIYLIEYKR